MKKIIVPTGYMGSGSSAITDLVSEFRDCQNDYKSYEYVLLHCPNGLFDLEDKLLLGNNALRSDEAIRSFYDQMKKLYDKKFWWVGNYKKIIGPEFMNVTDSFVKSLINFNYDGYWYTHEEVNGKMFSKLLVRKPFKILTRNKINFKKVLRYNDGMKICLPSSSEFYQKASKYIDDVVNLISNKSENVIIDQFLLPFNLYRIDNYFGDQLRVIVVERDPRDVFILNKYIWQEKGISVPLPTDVIEFCEYYRRMRESEKKCNSNKVWRIRFEDLIYQYDKTINEIMIFLNFTEKDHVSKKERFNPDVSIKNTQLFNDKKYQKEVEVIEGRLKEYLYEFPYVINNNVKETVEFE